MEDLSYINAEWARKILQKKKQIEIDTHINECLNSIKLAVNHEMSFTIVDRWICDEAVEELENRGFKISRNDNQKEGPTTTINW